MERKNLRVKLPTITAEVTRSFDGYDEISLMTETAIITVMLITLGFTGEMYYHIYSDIVCLLINVNVSLEDHLYHPPVVKEKQQFWRRILIVDDEADVTITFKAGIEDSNNDTKKRIDVHTSNDPVVALSEFKPDFYDLLLVDINMPHIQVI
jgi:hypothetical protein